jgi:small GTP-binding protein
MPDHDPTRDAPAYDLTPDDTALLSMLDQIAPPGQPDPDAGPDAVAQARESLEETIGNLKLTPEEERAMADELRQLRDLTRKLDETSVEIAAFGMVSRGKSSVLNALLGKDVFKTGTTHGTTVARSEQHWEQVSAERPGLGGATLRLVDTPGIDEVGGEAREAMARDVARRADLILFVVSSDMQRVEIESLSRLREAQKPIILVFNQIDRYPEADRDQIYAKIKDERVRHLIRPEDVVMTAARPDPFKVKIQLPDGTTSVQWERPAPVIEPLKARILDVLEREGKALVALNTLLAAGDLHEEIVAHKLRIREDAANRLVWNFCLAKGAAVGLNPIPVADLAGGLAVDVGMIVALSKVYGIPLTKKTAAGLVREMMVALGAMGMVEVATRLIASGVKSSLAGLTVISGGIAFLGYGAIGLALGSSAAATTYVLGHGAKVYLRQGCQWGPRGIKTVIQQIVAQAKADSVVDRLKDDLKARLGG